MTLCPINRSDGTGGPSVAAALTARSRLGRMARLPVLILLGGGLLCGCYDSRFGSPERDDTVEPVTSSIAELRKRFLGTPFVVNSDISVNGRVVSSDQAGNFYRSICIEKEQAALEILTGIDQSHNLFPVGCSVTLRLKGLTVAEKFGVLQVGAQPQSGSGYDVDYIGSLPALEKCLVRNSEELVDPQPARLTIPELDPLLCGTLVRIDNLQYTPESETESGWSGYRKFVDPDGCAIHSYVRDYADFADREIPEMVISLIGILQYDNSGEGRFLLKLRDETDCLF